MAVSEAIASANREFGRSDVQAAWFGELLPTDGHASGILADSCGRLDVPVTRLENALRDRQRRHPPRRARHRQRVLRPGLVVGADKARETSTTDTFWDWMSMTPDMACAFPLDLVPPPTSTAWRPPRAAPAFPRLCDQGFAESTDTNLALACVIAYNDWMVEEWCGDSGGLLISICLIPLWDAAQAAREVRRNAARGVHAAAFNKIPAHLGLPSIAQGAGTRCSKLARAREHCLDVIGSSSHIPATSADAPPSVTATLGSDNAMLSLVDFVYRACSCGSRSSSWRAPAGANPKVTVTICRPMANFLGHCAARPGPTGLAGIRFTTRYVGDDTSLIMDNCLLDMATMVRHLLWPRLREGRARRQPGGASSAPYNQAQARRPTITDPPGGGPDLSTADLVPVDGVVLFNAHPSRARLSTEWLDPSITTGDSRSSAIRRSS